MAFIEIKNKAAYLKKESPFRDIPKLTDRKCCCHCDTWFTVGDYKVQTFGSFEYICCPNAPECSGTIIDWLDGSANGKEDPELRSLTLTLI